MKHVSWKEIDTIAEKLVQKIKKGRFAPDYLIGITVGGLVPLALIAKKLDIRNTVTVSAVSYEGTKQKKLSITYLPKINLRNKKILLVDDIADTGNTLKEISRILIKRYGVKKVKTAVFVVNKNHCAYKPDFYVIEETRWIVFPWEK